MRLLRPLIAPCLLAWLVAFAVGCGADVAASGSLTAGAGGGGQDAPERELHDEDGDGGSSIQAGAPGAADATEADDAGAEALSSCAARTVELSDAAPDVLIVLDRSLSMSLNRRWEPSKSALKTITHDFAGLIRFGLSMFPGPGGDCTHGALDVPLGLANADTIARAIDGAKPSGLTPTGPALQESLKFLRERKPSLDGDAPPPAVVLLVTDGEPNCQVLPLFEDSSQQEAAKAAVSALKAENIPTHVIGYQIASTSQGVMNELARLGGTGAYSPAQSAEQIVTTFREIAKNVITCSFVLTEPTDPRFLRLSLDARDVPAESADGWTLAGKTLTLRGAACTQLKDGRGHSVRARLECDEIPVSQ